MADLIENTVHKSLESAASLYHRLVLIVGAVGSGKGTLIARVAQKHGAVPLNLSACLSEELLELTVKQRLLKVPKLLEHIATNHLCHENATLFLDHIEILFDTTLKQDPLRLLQSLSRNVTILAPWHGTFSKGKLTYANPDHDEYKQYDAHDILLVHMDDCASVDIHSKVREI